MKTCNKCGVAKPPGDFGRSAASRDGLKHECKRCTAVYAANKYATDKLKPGFKEHRAVLRSRSRYGATHAELLTRQGGACGICRRDLTSSPTINLHIDHDHDTGRVRALLCRTCNCGLGKFGDDPNRMLDAAEYLLAHEQSFLDDVKREIDPFS